MLAVQVNRDDLEYDVNALVKAFYPDETVKVLTPGMSEEKRARCRQAVRISVALSEDKEESGYVSVDGKVFPWAYLSGREEKGGSGISGQRGTPKESFKRFLYRVLSRRTGKELPWGSLTGIRPAKLAFGLLEEGKTQEEILAFLRETYYVSEEKSRLSLEIARRERAVLAGIFAEASDGSDGYSLYLGIPFCPTTCLYCSFTSYPAAKYALRIDKYVDCLIREMEAAAEQFRGRRLDSVYIGGGTPTTLEAAQWVRLLESLQELFAFRGVREFTVEAGRADSITGEKLRVLHRYGVDRISVNPQTMNPETLRLIGRRHTVEQVAEAYRLARETGFANINMDLILGLPGEGEKEVSHTMSRVAELDPDSLTVHSLAVKRASGLGRWADEHGTPLLRNTQRTMEIAAQGAERLGMKPYYLYRQKNMAGNYENVGYARPGKFGLYNILMMEEKQTIVALGAGSITKLVLPGGRVERCENIKDVDLYMEKTQEMIGRRKRFIEERT
jgi:oxygen-independent coproporphyrinogen-3 oxidase